MNKNNKIIKFIPILSVLIISLNVTLQNFAIKSADSNEFKISEFKAKAADIVNMSIEEQTYILSNLFFDIINTSTKEELFSNIRNSIQKIIFINDQFYNIINDLKFIDFIIDLIANKHKMLKLEVAAALNTEGSIAFVKQLIKDMNLNCNKMLIWAVDNGYIGVVKLLLGFFDINVNVKNSYGFSPLTSAADNGNTEIVKLLLAHPNIDANIRDCTGRTALIIAAFNNHNEIVKLLANDININAKDNHGNTALSLVAFNGHTETTKLLLSYFNTDVNILDFSGRTALIIAVDKDNIEIVKLLLEHPNIDINAQYKLFSITALLIAVGNGNTEIVKLLLGHSKIDVNIKNNKGETALDIAKIRNNRKIIKLIKEYIRSKNN